MLNVVAIMGRLARDPELRQTTTGKNVASFRIACDRGRRDANGQSQADWIDVVAWDRQAEFVCKYFQKGSLIVVDGRLQSRSYQDKTAWYINTSNIRNFFFRPVPIFVQALLLGQLDEISDYVNKDGYGKKHKKRRNRKG